MRTLPASASPSSSLSIAFGACLGLALLALPACNKGQTSNAPVARTDTDSDLPGGPDASLIDEQEAMAATASTAPSVPRPADVIYREELKRATKNGRPAYLLAQLNPEPYRPRGSREGWLITRVFPSDPDLCAPGCDLMPGDIILTVNGNPLERPEQLSALIAELETMEALEVRLVRDQKLHTRTYKILDEAAL